MTASLFCAHFEAQKVRLIWFVFVLSPIFIDMTFKFLIFRISGARHPTFPLNIRLSSTGTSLRNFVSQLIKFNSVLLSLTVVDIICRWWGSESCSGCVGDKRNTSFSNQVLILNSISFLSLFYRAWQLRYPARILKLKRWDCFDLYLY